MSNSENNVKKTKYCYSCGEEISSQVRFCPECGADQNISEDESPPQADENNQEVLSSQKDTSKTKYRVQTDSSKNQERNQKTKEDPSIKLLGIKTNPSWGYTSMYVSFLIVVIGAISDPVLLLIGYVALGTSVYADVSYVRQMSDWDPSAKKYIAGIILLFIVFFPLYISRRRRAMRNVDPIN